MTKGTKAKTVPRKCSTCHVTKQITPRNGVVPDVCQKCYQTRNAWNGARR